MLVVLGVPVTARHSCARTLPIGVIGAHEHSMPDSKPVQSATNTATACANTNLEALRSDMLSHTVKAPRSLSRKYVLTRVGEVEARQTGMDPPAHAWQK